MAAVGKMELRTADNIVRFNLLFVFKPSVIITLQRVQHWNAFTSGDVRQQIGRGRIEKPTNDARFVSNSCLLILNFQAPRQSQYFCYIYSYAKDIWEPLIVFGVLWPWVHNSLGVLLWGEYLCTNPNSQLMLSIKL